MFDIFCKIKFYFGLIAQPLKNTTVRLIVTSYMPIYSLLICYRVPIEEKSIRCLSSRTVLTGGSSSREKL